MTGGKKSGENLQNVTQALVLKIDDLENRSRRCNLLFYGVKDVDACDSWSVWNHSFKNCVKRGLA